jgi:hypothetical protein
MPNQKPFSQETICTAVKKAINSLSANPSAATAKSQGPQRKPSFWQALFARSEQRAKYIEQTGESRKLGETRKTCSLKVKTGMSEKMTRTSFAT